MHRTLSLDKFYEQKNMKGDSTGGISGCLKTLETLLKSSMLKGYYPVFTWDRGISERRKNLDKDYKDKKAVLTSPEESSKDEYVQMYREQRNKLIDVLDAFGIPNFLIDNQEGDDTGRLLTTLTADCICVTSDKDWLQNLSSNHVKVYNPIKKILYTEENLNEHFGCDSVKQFLTEKILLGDPSDNIPSCIYGIGEKGIHFYYNFFKEFYKDGKWNLDAYPKTEEDCKALCEKINVPYRKAFLNLDTERFFVNEQLINLDYVENDIDIINSIISTIDIAQTKKSFMQVIKALKMYDITNVDYDTINRELMQRRNSIYSK